MDSCVDALSTVLEVGGHDTELATRACSGLESAFFQRQLQDAMEEPQEGTMDVQSPVDVLFLWACSALVFMMQAGFAMLCVGSVRVKNAKNILLKNIIDGCAAALVFYFIGYGLAYGTDSDGNGNPFIGIGDFALAETGKNRLWHGWFFQWAFCAAAATIVSGSVAERCKFEAYILYSVFITGFMYPVVVHWIWAEHGWLSAFNEKPLFGVGVVDFAGCLVVHFVGGASGFIGAAILGPRKGRFDANGKVVETDRFGAHSAPLVCLGTFLLWVGWYGFNPGSALAISSVDAMELVTRSAVTTTLAAGAAGVTTVIWIKYRTGVFDMVALCNGILAGLVSITSGCASVAPWAAVLIGIAAAILFNLAEEAILKFAKVDDPLSASAMHGAIGIFGVLMPPLFGKESHVLQSTGWTLEGLPSKNAAKGLFYGGDGRMLGATIVGILAVSAWVFVFMTLFFFALKKANMLRVTEEDEDAGMDVTKHGGLAYNNQVSNLAQVLGNSRVSPGDGGEDKA